jgi:hypothetical protein
MTNHDDIVIFRYTRAQAIRDGVLIDVSELAREAGFRMPVAITAAAWGLCVVVPHGVTGQDETGRLWDVLWMLRYAIGRSERGLDEIRFCLHVRNSDEESVPPLVKLKALCGPGDDAEPVITILLPDED